VHRGDPGFDQLFKLAAAYLHLLDGQDAEAHARIERRAQHTDRLAGHGGDGARGAEWRQGQPRRYRPAGGGFGGPGVSRGRERRDYRDAVVDSPDQPQPPLQSDAQAGSDQPGPLVPEPVEPLEPLEPEAVVPPVVIAMVTHDPGPWFEESLASVVAQGYPNASLLVIDSGSTVDLEERIAAVAPHAHMRRVDRNVGFGPAANEVLHAVEGAAFYLFCHDDVRLDPDVVQVMVEEAYRSNAGVIGGKVVEWADPQRILQVGMGADKTGAPAPYVERGELDQEQHDAVRDVFYVPGAATLVRADLFEALGGFDSGIEMLGEDLDLSWRAHVAGARVVVAPGARLGHLEALGTRRPVDDRRRLQMRHRLRTSRICYTWSSRVRVMPQVAVIALVELLYSLVVGRFRHASDIAHAWTWNARHRGEIRTQRKQLRQHRAVPDEDVRRLQVRGSSRLSGFLRGQLGPGEDRLGTVAGAGRDLVTNLRSSSVRSSLVAWTAVVVLLAVGSRQLITDGIPTTGSFAAFPSHPSALLHEWVSGYRDIGLGSETAAPTLLAALGGLGYLFFGAMGLLRTVLIVGALPLGVLGIWRLARPLGSRRARIVALIIYACVPIGFNAVAQGRWPGLVMYGLAPWMINQLARASGLAPYGSIGGDPGPGVTDRPLVQRVLLLGLVSALAAMLVPFALVIVPAVALAFALGGLLVGQVRGAARLIGVGLGGTLTALVLQLPWSVSLLTGGWQAFVGTSSDGGRPLSLAAIFRFETGPFGAPPIGWVFLPVGLLALVIGRRWRLAWAVRCWVVVMAGAGLVFVGAQGWLPGSLPLPEVLLAPAAVALALATGLGMAAFEVDLPDYHFGWRQIASVLAGVALLLGLFPAVAAASSGRWGLPDTDFARPLHNLSTKGAAVDPYRVLWLGDADLLPSAGWPLDAPAVDNLGPGALLAYATSQNGMPDVSDVLAGSDQGATSRLDQVLQTAAAGGTSRLGALLAPMGVRYIAVPLANAPRPFETGPAIEPTAVLTMLDAQLDLSNVDVARGIVVYRNAEWAPTRALLAPDTAFPSADAGVTGSTLPGLAGASTALPDQSGYESFSGSIDQPSSVYLAEASSGNWQLDVDGNRAPRSDVLGWSNAFAADAGAKATLAYDTPLSRGGFLAGQVLIWLAVLLYLFRTRVRIAEARDLAELEAEGGVA
jgi:GT2 family glycosyltransferase